MNQKLKFLKIAIYLVILGLAMSSSSFAWPWSNSAPPTPQQQFQQIQSYATTLRDKGDNNVGSFSSGITMDEALHALLGAETVGEIDKIYGNIEFKKFLTKFSYEYKIATGDILKSIILFPPKGFPEDVKYIALGFFNDRLHKVTYIYEPRELITVTPKEAKYANAGSSMEAKASNEKWDALTARVISAAQQKYASTSLSYYDFFGYSLDPEQITPNSDWKESVLFHGVSKTAVAHIAYIKQDELKTGAFDDLYTVITYRDNRFVVASFYFLDCARNCAFPFYERKLKASQEEGERMKQMNSEAQRKQGEAASKAAEEDRRKADMLRKSF